MGKRNKGYSKKKQAEVEDRVRDLAGKNYTDLEIGIALNLQPHIVRHYKDRIYAKAKVFFESLTPERVLGDPSQRLELKMPSCTRLAWRK